MATLSKADKELVRERERMKEKEKEKELDKELEKELTRERERLREVEREKELVRDRERMKEREKEREKLLREKQERSSKDPSPAHSSASSSASSSPSDSPASQARAHLASAALAPVLVIAAWPNSGKCSVVTAGGVRHFAKQGQGRGAVVDSAEWGAQAEKGEDRAAGQGRARVSLASKQGQQRDTEGCALDIP
jgi:hypothetical protein